MGISSEPKRKGITEIPAEVIRRRAYEIDRERGEQPGREQDDWLQAERETKRGMFLNQECRSATADTETRRMLNCHDLGDC